MVGHTKHPDLDIRDGSHAVFHQHLLLFSLSHKCRNDHESIKGILKMFKNLNLSLPGRLPHRLTVKAAYYVPC